MNRPCWKCLKQIKKGEVYYKIISSSRSCHTACNTPPNSIPHIIYIDGIVELSTKELNKKYSLLVSKGVQRLDDEETTLLSEIQRERLKRNLYTPKSEVQE